jgi:raffinose/stachyose/melibiose transport system substrate-binding protein
MKIFTEKNKNILALTILTVGFIFCIFQHINTVRKLKPRDKRTVLLAHWQGERGCEEALQKVIDAYNELHPDVKVRQQIIVGSGSSFVRWCVTQIIGGSPPDIMEYNGRLTTYLSNYFVGLAEYVNEPNPYNKNNKFRDIPWKDTFYGGMRGSWVSELMNYYSIPNTLYTTRFYYNKDIFRKATGSDKPPKTMREFIEICEKIEKLGVVPVIVENAKGGQGVNFFNTLYSQVAWNVQDEIDYNRDGLISSAEFLRAFTLENYNIDTPMMRALMTLMTDFSKQWGKGFNAIDMTIAPFMFIQEKGACYLGGSWLGRQMLASCKFDLGYFAFPLITEEDPIAGKFYCGPWGENNKEPGMSLAVAKGPNVETAIDFLRFLTTPKNNSTFNAGPAWVPGVLTAEIDPAVKAFKPLIRGKNVRNGFAIKSVGIEFKRIMQNYLAGDYGYEEALDDLKSCYSANGLKDNLRAARDSFRRIVKLEEIRYRLEQKIEKARNPAEKESRMKKLKKLYESQILALNTINVVYGIDKEVSKDVE